MSLLKRRNPLAALIFSLLMPGLGQIYNGQAQKALIFYGFFVLVDPCTIYFGLGSFNHFTTYVSYCAFIYVSSAVDALIIALRAREIEKRKYNEWYYYILIYLVALFINDTLIKHVRANVAEAFRVTSSSMEPTIQKDDHVVVDKMIYDNVNISRGDVVVYKVTIEDVGGEEMRAYVKRVIGLPGDRIEVRKDKLYINDVEYVESYAVWEKGGAIDFLPQYVPANHIMVLGDNRDHSMDSRTYKEPFVHASKVLGKVSYIVFSYDFDRIGKNIN